MIALWSIVCGERNMEAAAGENDSIEGMKMLRIYFQYIFW